MTPTKASRLFELTRHFQDRRILVLGDLILDRFVWGRVERISPEAPVPVIEVQRESLHLGGAANVAANLAVLGARPILAGLTGEDDEALLLLRRLAEKGIDHRAVIADPSRRTTNKTRIIAGHQQVCRADREDRMAVSGPALDRLLQACHEALGDCDALIVSDYAKGVLTTQTSSAVIGQARKLGRFVAVDPKVGDFSFYRGASVVTPNVKETESAAGQRIADRSELSRVGRHLMEQAQIDHLLVTRGEEGMTLFETAGEFDIPAAAREVFDVTGAGDTVISVFTLATAASADLREAAVLANHAAGVAVGKLGTAEVTVEEILRSADVA